MVANAEPRSVAVMKRREQRDATRARLLEGAVSVLIERGVAGTTTLAVQERCGVGRGTLLHHFPTHADLLSSTVAALARRNEANVAAEAVRRESLGDPLERAIRVMTNVASQPSYLAEHELWTVSRTDKRLWAALRAAEHDARGDYDRVLTQLFGSIADEPGGPMVIRLSVEFARGLAVSGILRVDPGKRERLVREWVEAATMIIAKMREANAEPC
jgi:AcrR family transcriptional regulator